MRAFDDAQTTVLGRAYTRALDNFMREHRIEPKELETAKERLATRLLTLADAGEKDEWRLARGGLLYLRGMRWRDTGKGTKD